VHTDCTDCIVRRDYVSAVAVAAMVAVDRTERKCTVAVAAAVSAGPALVGCKVSPVAAAAAAPDRTVRMGPAEQIAASQVLCVLVDFDTVGPGYTALRRAALACAAQVFSDDDLPRLDLAVFASDLVLVAANQKAAMAVLSEMAIDWSEVDSPKGR